MKILVICPLTSDSGGAVTSWNISKQLAVLGNEVWFIERGFRKQAKRQTPSVRYLRSIDFPPFLPLNILLSLMLNIIVVLIVRADVVFALKCLPNSCLPAMIAKLMGAKTILHINDLDYEFYDEGILRKIVHFFYRFFPRFFDCVSFPSIKLKEYVQRDLRLEEKRLKLLLQGVDFDKFKKAESSDHLRKQFGLINCRVIIYVASLGITTDFEWIAKLFLKILQKIENVKFLVIGGGSNLVRFRKVVDDSGLGKQVVFTGFVKHEDIPLYLTLGDIGINYMENNKANHFRVPIKVKEYLAAGLPVVTNEIGDYYLLKDHICMAGNVDEFVQLVKQALDSHDEDYVVRQNVIEETYNWKYIIQKFKTTVEELVRP